MAATRTKCWKQKCKGVPMACNDGIARLAERLGRLHYKCDKCHQRWSITPEQMKNVINGKCSSDPDEIDEEI